MSTQDNEFSSSGTSGFDESGFSTSAGEQTTSFLPPSQETDKQESGEGTRWHGGLDLGLLLLRLMLGVTMVAHGSQKVFGLFDGPGIGGFAQSLAGMGFSSTTLLAWVTGFSELVGGLLLALGLFTPLGAAAILGVTANIVYLKFGSGFFTGPKSGFEYELLLGVVALALLFTGAGRAALDVHTPWRRKPLPFAILGVLVAAAATVVTLVVFH